MGDLWQHTLSACALSVPLFQYRSLQLALSLSLSLTLVLALAFKEGYQALSLSLLISLTLYGYSLSHCLSATTAVDRTQLHWHSRWGRVATPRKMQGKWTVASSCDFRVRAACVDGKTAGVKYNQKKTCTEQQQNNSRCNTHTHSHMCMLALHTYLDAIFICKDSNVNISMRVCVSLSHYVCVFFCESSENCLHYCCCSTSFIMLRRCCFCFCSCCCCSQPKGQRTHTRFFLAFALCRQFRYVRAR